MQEYSTVQEVAKLLKVEEMSIYNWINAGTLKATKIGNHLWRIKKEDLDAFINNK